MSERDPRVDPRPGDVLRKPNYPNYADGRSPVRTVTVISVAHGAVRITSDPPIPRDVNYFHHADWPFLMRNAEVITRAEDAALVAVLRPVVEGE